MRTARFFRDDRLEFLDRRLLLSALVAAPADMTTVLVIASEADDASGTLPTDPTTTPTSPTSGPAGPGTF